MYIYLIFPFLSFLAAFLNNQRALAKAILFFLCIFLIIFAGFRDVSVGVDTFPYIIRLFAEDFHYQEIKVSSQILFHFYNYIFKIFFPYAEAYIFFTFLFSFLLKYTFYLKHCANVFIALLIYYLSIFIIFEINGIRMGLALGVLTWAYHFIEQGKFLYFLLLTLVASQIHYGMLIFLPAYFLLKIKLKAWHYCMILICILFLSYILPILTNIFGGMMRSLDSKRLEYYEEAYTSFSLYHPAVLKRIVCFSVLLFIESFFCKNKNRMAFNAYFISVCIFIISNFSLEIAFRFSFVYKIFEIILISSIWDYALKNKQGTVFSLLLLVIVLEFISFLRIFAPEYSALIPYSLWLWK